MIISCLREQLSRNIFRDEKGLATIQYLFVIVTVTVFMFFIFTQALNITVQNQLKSAVNRATKAAALSYSEEKLVIDGVVEIDETEARQKFEQILEDNLKAISHWSVETFQVIDQEDHTFPKKIKDGSFTHTFNDPGVWAVVQAEIPKFGGGVTTFHTPAVAEVSITIDH